MAVNKQDDELDKLEEDIRKLKNKYDQFFNGLAKVPPMIDRQRVEGAIHELNKEKMRDSTRRFRFNTIQSRYNQFRELWGRRMREREEGPVDFRRRQSALHQEPAPPAPDPPKPSRPVTSNGDDPYVKMTPGADGDQIRMLYEQIRIEHERIGRPANVSLDQLAAMVQKQTESIREKYNVRTVAFRVETVDGKVKLKAKPLQD